MTSSEPADGAPGPGSGSAPWLAVATLAGACTMGVELSAVRLLAPWFGTSSVVWTNVIGVILLALALGYLAGARLAAGSRPGRSLGLALLAASATTAWLPFLARPVATLFVPEGLPLEVAAGGWATGSLAATLVLFLPPALFLGCIGPLAVELVQRADHSHAGAAGGRVLGLSTLGSLAGTFATTHTLVPGLGLRWTYVLFAGVLGALALFVLVRERAAGRTRGVGAALALVALAGSAFGDLARPPLPDGLELLESAESRYQSVRAVEDRRGDPVLRLLQVNEGLDSFQSVWRAEPGPIGPSFYYDGFALPLAWDAGRPSWRVLVCGLGAGTVFRVLDGTRGPSVELELHGIELDEEVVRLGRRWFELADDGDGATVIAGVDGRAGLAAVPGALDLVIVDAYANQMEIPPHLASREFFAELRARLAPGGWVVVNVGGFGHRDPVVRAIGATVRAELGAARLLAVPRSRNVLVVARESGALPEPGSPGFRGSGTAADRLASLLAALEVPGASRLVDGDDGPILDDDRAPIEALQRRSMELGRARRGP